MTRTSSAQRRQLSRGALIVERRRLQLLLARRITIGLACGRLHKPLVKQRVE